MNQRVLAVFFFLWTGLLLSVRLPDVVQAQSYIMPPWPDGIGYPIAVGDQITTAVRYAEQQQLTRDWSNCLRCLKLAVGGETSNLSGYRSFGEPMPPIPATFNGMWFDFTMPFESGAVLKVRMVKDRYVTMEWRPAPMREGGLAYRVQTAAGEIECPNGWVANYVAYRNGK